MTIDFGTLTVLFPLLLLLLGVTFTVVIDPYIRREHRRTMLVIAVLCLTLIIQNDWDYALTVGPPRQMLRTMVSIYGYSVRPIILILFLHIVQPTGKRWYWWLLAGVNAAVYLTAVVSPVSFWIDEGNYYHGGPLAPSCLLTSMVLLICLFVQTFHSRSTAGKWDVWIPILVVLMVVVSIWLDFSIKEGQQRISFLTMTIIVGSVFYYIWLHLQFVREHEQDLMAQQRIQIMMTQIQPHFLYNTIATFKALCRRDPERAAEVAEKFGAYLRQNLDTLGQSGLIPFSREQEHTRLYTDIEMVRFDNIRVLYDIEDAGFSLPPLTLQPVVENAIRHGVRFQEEGVVRVITRRRPGYHEIIVADNGVGFDTQRLKRAEGGHIGLRNVRERIEGMCSGTLEIESTIGCGTTVIIRIPAEEAAQ